MRSRHRTRPKIRTLVRRKEIMLTVLILAAAYAAARGAIAAARSLGDLPRSNDDMVFF